MKFKIPTDIKQNLTTKQQNQIVLLISYFRYAIPVWLERNAIIFKEEQVEQLDTGSVVQYCKGLLQKRLRVEKARSNKKKKRYTIQVINEVINFFI
jgi:DNA-binding transcriptional regulator WhiA